MVVVHLQPACASIFYLPTKSKKLRSVLREEKKSYSFLYQQYIIMISPKTKHTFIHNPELMMLMKI